MNHKVHAHVYSYSRLDVATGNLHLRCLLPCDKGEQIFLAYGPASNQKVLENSTNERADESVDFVGYLTCDGGGN